MPVIEATRKVKLAILNTFKSYGSYLFIVLKSKIIRYWFLLIYWMRTGMGVIFAWAKCKSTRFSDFSLSQNNYMFCD